MKNESSSNAKLKNSTTETFSRDVVFNERRLQLEEKCFKLSERRDFKDREYMFH